MAYEAKPGTFALFKNDKQGNEKRPDYTGTGADMDGNPIRVSAWLKDGAKGKFMSCKFEYPQEASKPHESLSRGSPHQRQADPTDDIPF